MPASKGNIRKRRNRWEINWLDAGGKRRWKTFRKKRDARTFLREKQVEAERVRVGLQHAADPTRTWRDLVDLWQDRKSHKKSLGDDLSRIRCHLDPVLDGVRLVELDAEQARRVERALRIKVDSGELSPTTTRKVLILLQGMLRLAHRHQWVNQVPAFELPRERKVDFQWLDRPDDIRRFLDAARDDPYPGALQLFATAIYTGMRAGELFGLQWSDLDFGNRLLTVQRSYETSTKSDKIRRVPMVDPLVPLLQDWRSRCHSDLWVFPNERGDLIRPDNRVTDQVFHRVRESAGVKRIRFHDLRHTFASHYMLEGGDIYRLQRILGHSSVKVTERYAHLSPRAFEQDRKRLPDFLGGE